MPSFTISTVTRPSWRSWIASLKTSMPPFSAVTELELYSYPDLNDEEEAGITRLLADMFVVPLESRIARYAGYLRRVYRLKTPDSAIATTAVLTKTTLLTRNVDDFRQIDHLKLQEI
jgi:predicted nucleic acid-binding protein